MPVVGRKVQRTAGFRSELILHPRRARFPCGVQKKIIRIEDAVAQVFVSFPVKVVRPTFRAQVGHSSGETSPFRSQVAGLNFELLDGILGGNQHRQVDIADIQWLAVEIFGTLISKGTAYLVIAPPERIHADGGARGTALGNHGRSEDNEIENIAPVQGQFVRLSLLDDRSYRGGFCIDRRRLSRDGDALGGRSQHHFKVHFQCILHVENYVGLNHGLKAELFHLDSISSWRQIGYIVFADFVGEAQVVNPRTGIDDRD